MRGSRVSVDIDQVNWRSLKDLFPYLAAYKLRIGLAVLCLIAAKFASVALPFILKQVVDQLNQPVGGAEQWLLIPLGLLLAYGLVRFSNVLFGELRDTLFGRVNEGAMHRISYKVFEHLHSLDLNFHLNRRTGGLSREIERGVNGISFLLRFMVFNIVPTFVEISLIAVLLLVNYNVWFALIVLVSVTAYVAFSVMATERRTRFIRQMNKAESESSTRSVDSLLNFETVKYFTNEQYEAQLYDENLTAWEVARRSNRLTLFGLNAGQSLIIAIAMTSAMILAAYYVRQGVMTLGDFVLINALMMQIFTPLNFLGFVYREMKGSMANIDAMFALLKVRPQVQDSEQATQLQVTRGYIEFDKVSFGYDQQRGILHEVSFAVQPKQKLAIVGSSGSGKSTIMKLLFRFYNLDNGQIRIDGQNIADVTQNSLRKAISVVSQDAVLFNGSLWDNIHYGNVSATDEQVNAAISMAYLDEFIKQLPDGAQTRVGERGLKLSGGEKQRVAIARAILKQPKIMIFDEATSSLDSAAEQKILYAMERVRRDHTSVVIAHRLSTIIDADHILVLEQGKVVEQGTHSELLENQDRYAALWQIQNSNAE